MNVDLILNL
ncbi:unnamed protein product [Larinioides sclopetarius]|uniref:Uncharacterized protein n=1 Tax=Larinioides sclopetarius TaxID=280406 RepID=A0AAV2ARA3_9ARAC